MGVDTDKANGEQTTRGHDWMEEIEQKVEILSQQVGGVIKELESVKTTVQANTEAILTLNQVVQPIKNIEGAAVVLKWLAILSTSVTSIIAAIYAIWQLIS